MIAVGPVEFTVIVVVVVAVIVGVCALILRKIR